MSDDNNRLFTSRIAEFFQDHYPESLGVQVDLAVLRQDLLDKAAEELGETIAKLGGDAQESTAAFYDGLAGAFAMKAAVCGGPITSSSSTRSGTDRPRIDCRPESPR
jgi:hypothetical protein